MKTSVLPTLSRFPALAVCCLSFALCAAANAEDKADQPEKTRDVKVKDITLTVPESWKEQEPSNRLRLAQFDIPAAEGEKEPVELTIFSFGGSSIQANVQRWIGQFDAKGRKAKVTQGESPQGKYVFVDLSGSYNQPVGPPVLRRTRKLPDARMLAVILVVKEKGVYFLKMAGANKTVSAAADAFRASFGADPKKEKTLQSDAGEE